MLHCKFNYCAIMDIQR